MKSWYFSVVTAVVLSGACISGGQAQEPVPTTIPEVIGECEIAPDYFTGNCPPTVNQFLEAAGGAVGDALNLQIADLAVALVQRGQQAATEFDTPLCIDIAQGIVAAAEYSSDPDQQESIRELAKFACCVFVEGTDYGLGAGGTEQVPLSGPADDGVAIAGVSIFQSEGATFLTDGVQAGDILVILDGEHEGMFLIEEVGDEMSLILADTAVFSLATVAETGLTFDIRRPLPDMADHECDPGFKTASIVPEEPEIIIQASPN